MAAAYGHTKAGVFRSMLRTPGMRREEREIAAARRGAARVLRQAADGLSLGPAGVLALLREPPPARDRARDRDEPAHPAARRAGRRDEPVRDARDHRADRAAPRRGRLHDPRDRARHARRRGHLRPRHRARPRRQDRRGLVRAGRDEPEGRRGVPRPRRRHDDANERAARARRRRHLLRPDPHPAGAVDPDRAAASSSACSAATPRASRRR